MMTDSRLTTTESEVERAARYARYEALRPEIEALSDDELARAADAGFSLSSQDEIDRLIVARLIQYQRTRRRNKRLARNRKLPWFSRL